MSTDLHVRYARLRKADRDTIFRMSREHASVLNFDPAAFETLLNGIANDRLAFADRLLAHATNLLASSPGLLPPGDDLPARDALAKIYYAAHHAMRALHLSFERWDPDGHEATIRETRAVFTKRPNVAAHFSALGDVADGLNTLMDERHVADYHFYNRQDELDMPVDFKVLAPTRLTWAAVLVPLVSGAIVAHRTGVLS